MIPPAIPGRVPDHGATGNKIPGLGDIPGLGRLFGSNKDDVSKSELVLSITPRIVRNLPYHAATAAAYGLPADEALKSITLYPAQILGVADRLGSIETGKVANLVVTDGSLLEIRTHVKHVFINGRPVPYCYPMRLEVRSSN